MNEENYLIEEYLKTGDRRYFDELYKQSKQWLYRMIYRIIPDKDSADEVFQETWVQVLKNLNRFDPNQGKFSNYLYTVAKNRALKERMSKAKHISESLYDNSNDDFYGSDNHSPDKVTEIWEKNHLLMKSLDKIDKDYKDVLILHYLGELEVKEIAVQMSKPEGTIKTWLSRGRDQLKKVLIKTNYKYYLEPALWLLLYFFTII